MNTASHIHAAEFVARIYTDSYQLGDGELLVCTVNIPAGVSAITQEMIDTSERINRTIGIDISDSVTSTRSDVAASSLAVKKPTIWRKASIRRRMQAQRKGIGSAQ